MGFNSSIRNRFPSARRPGLWADIPQTHWNSWVWQQQKRIKTIEQVNRVIPLTAQEKDAFQKSSDLFRVAITPYYASLIDPQDPDCPIRLQAIPQPGELSILETEMEDPLAEEDHMPVPGITHRYPDRVLFYTSHNCPVYCRHCTRKRKVSNPSTAATLKQIDAGMEYIARTPSVRDVLVSGGDPLSNSDERLEMIFSRLRSIPHVEIIRLSTRNLVTLPQRVTSDLAKILSRHHPVFVHTHFNHPKECTREAFDACALLADAGCVVQNQMVLLKGINDDPKTVLELNHRLMMMRVRPYYIHQCDNARGLGHFRTSIQTGLNILEKLRGWTSGMAVPHYAVDLPGGGGKVTLVPEYLIKREGRKWTFRNYQGNEFDYWEPEISS